MKKTPLHITNGQSLTDFLKELDIQGDFLTWIEMLCEGPAITEIESKEFILTRKTYLSETYDIEIDVAEYNNEIGKLDHFEKYSEIILWFEYDLFCHINLIAVISLLQQKDIKLPLYLVCSGWVEGQEGLNGLAELSPEQLLQHYNDKVKLDKGDIDLAISLWKTYCGKDHNLFKPYIVKKSSFKYLTNCLKAHLKRFPNSKNGLNALEYNILELVKKNEIKSSHHLLGYALNYQGYYGFGDIQLERLISNLSMFFDEGNSKLTLNRKGHEALLNQQNFSTEINNDIMYGGVNRLDFQYNDNENKLFKTTLNVN